MMDIRCLPVETFVEILKHTDGITLGKCRRVCVGWKQCVDEADSLWQEMCKKEFNYSSKIAKRKAGADCDWYHIYKNLKQWSKVTTFRRKLEEFYKFSLHDKNHALDIDYNILPLKDTKGIVMYDMTTLKYIPVTVPDKNCLKIANNDYASAILLKTGLYIQKTVDNDKYMSEAFFDCENFVLSDDGIYFYFNGDVFKCNLLSSSLSSKLLLHSDCAIKDIKYDDSIVYIFTNCGKIVNVTNETATHVKTIKLPPEWVNQIKYTHAINDKNFVCYSRNLFKLETDKSQHLYLEFPQITALFFYADIVLIGTRKGEILLYRLSSQKRATKPKFEKLGALPGGKFAVQLDVTERNTGPVIMVATFFEIYLMEIDFFPEERENKKSSSNKLLLYKRLLRLSDRVQLTYN